MGKNDGLLFSEPLLTEIRGKFAHVDEDPLLQRKRLFFDNACGSFRLKKATEKFSYFDSVPNCPQREHDTSTHLLQVEAQGFNDIRTIFNAKKGSIATYLTASKAMFDITGIIAENIEGT